MEWPEFDNKGDLPVGIHRATLAEMLQHFGTGTLRRTLIGQRLDSHFTGWPPVRDSWQDLWCSARLSLRNRSRTM